jgi:alpha-mannosidase
VALAVLPHAGPWHADGVPQQAERYQHELLAAPGTGPGLPLRKPEPPALREPAPPPAPLAEAAGLAVEGDGVALSALRRRGAWLELRLACQHPDPVTATVGGGLLAAREADLLGRPGAPLPLSGGALRLELGAWEIRTLLLRLPTPR